MRDLFFTILTVWVLWRIFSSFRTSNYGSQQQPFSSSNYKKEGEIEIKNTATNTSKSKKGNNDGEYVDYEEIK